jgi:subfamily B ATP-binding cassette protein MsbA
MLKAVLTGGSASAFGITFQTTDLSLAVPLAIVGLAVVKALSSFAHTGLMASVAQRALEEVRRALYAHVLALPPAWFERRHSGEVLSRFTSDVAAVEFAVGTALSSWIKDVLQAVALLWVCAAIDFRLFLLTFVVIPGMVLPVSRFAKSARRSAQQTQASLANLTELVAEHFNALPIVQVFGTQRRALERFDAQQAAYLSTMKRSLLIRGAFSPTTELLGIIGVALALVFGARAVSLEPSLAEKLVSFLAAALLMYQPIKALSGNSAQVAHGMGAALRLFEVLDEPLAPPRTVEVGPLKRLELSNVSFSHADGRPALTTMSLCVNVGEHVAIVGASGAGKSTLFSVLMGFAEPQSGRFRWNGVDMQTVSKRSLLQQLAWVPQDPILLSGTIRENLLLAKPDASEEELLEALQRAHAKDFVLALNGGLNHAVGERGASLSGGQRQRLAIARAFLKKPSLLLLDEPTSALDAESERAVQAGLSELMQGRTTLVIAHRLRTVRHASRIVVMDKGTLVEEGTWDTLWSRQGVFRALADRGFAFPDTPPT